MRMAPTDEEILTRKIKSLYPNEDERVWHVLSEYGREACEGDSNRVKLAILKLSGASIAKIKEYVQEAKKDCRDVLAWAEYPEQVRADTWKLSPEENRKMQIRDLEQYRAWLNE